MSFIKLTDLDLAGKRVLIRADLNVPVKDGKVTSDARITASMPTVEHCMKAGASVMVMSHRGRPEEGVADEENSMAPIAEVMSAKLGKDVKLVKNYLDTAPDVRGGEVVLLENVRFNAGEKKDNEDLLKNTLLYVMYLLWMHLVRRIVHRHLLMVLVNLHRQHVRVCCFQMNWIAWSRRWLSLLVQWLLSLVVPRFQLS